MTNQNQTNEEIEEKIFKIVARIIGTALQANAIDGRYSEDFSKYRNEILDLLLSHAKAVEERVREKIANDIQKIISESKATFFVKRGSEDIKIPTDEALYELKSEISDNIGMYFYKISQSLNKLNV